ncbi:MAG: PucR family transcriptional regulator [Aristaeellaceae bacterium]
MNKHLLEQMENTLVRLTVPVAVMDMEDDVHPHAELNMLTPGMVVPMEGRLYLAVKQPSLVLSCPAEAPGAADVLLLAGALVTAVAQADHHMENSYDVYRRVLRGDLIGAELEALSNEYQIPRELERCVMVFHMVQTENERAFDLLQDITPMQDQDVLVDMDRHTVVLIKDMTDVESVDDLTMYAQALQETLMGETAHQMTVGVGCVRATLDELQDSYAEARRAIEVGRVFQPEDSIYVFSRLILERFLMELPQDISAYYHNLLFNRRTVRLFNEEMLYTIDMFFKKDLNLSDTARQLYIHRNTLVYRLDKVQRQTGLDLRSFEDAVTFKILMELKKCGGDRHNRK